MEREMWQGEQPKAPQDCAAAGYESGTPSGSSNSRGYSNNLGQSPPVPPPQVAQQPTSPSGGAIPPVAPPKNTGRNNKGGWRRGIVTALVGGLVGALVVLLLLPWAFGVSPIDLMTGKLKKSSSSENTPKEVIKVVSPTEGAVDVSSIAKKVTPSIVNIDTRTAPQRTFLFEIEPQEGTGSGVIFSSDGYILTNNHVVESAEEITVTLANGEELKGKKVGADPETDIAVVKVEKNDLPALEVGNSDNLIVGQLVLAVGSPFGFEQSVTSGIVSALHRDVSAVSRNQSAQSSVLLADLIQTDAAINPGNSGGALCDSSGRLVGINTVIASSSGGSEGVGFSIPINTARKVADDIIAGKPISHPYLGVQGQSIGERIAKRLNLPVSKGAYVTGVFPDGPADKAGIKRGDIIVEFEGKPIESMDELVAEVRKKNVGDKAKLVFYSGNEKKSVEVTLAEKPKNL
ncbi:MAG: trypsin-like peptidase domain-containing protein [Actinomycetota bacterium]|nr:trypsin-like peptidase domain-containing protein [Actinomycetota bacterium]